VAEGGRLVEEVYDFLEAMVGLLRKVDQGS
jgi:hypothetical protein